MRLDGEIEGSRRGPRGPKRNAHPSFDVDVMKMLSVPISDENFALISCVYCTYALTLTYVYLQIDIIIAISM